MKKMLLVSLIAVLGNGVVMADSICAKKIDQIKRQLDYAKAHNNTYRIAGLERALSETQANCTDSGERYRMESDIRKAQREVEEVEEDIVERKDDIRQAQAKGDIKKVTKLQQKLRTDQAKLTEKKNKVRALQVELGQYK